MAAAAACWEAEITACVQVRELCVRLKVACRTLIRASCARFFLLPDLISWDTVASGVSRHALHLPSAATRTDGGSFHRRRRRPFVPGNALQIAGRQFRETTIRSELPGRNPAAGPDAKCNSPKWFQLVC